MRVRGKGFGDGEVIGRGNVCDVNFTRLDIISNVMVDDVMLGTIVIDRIFTKEDCRVVVIEDCSRRALTKA